MRMRGGDVYIYTILGRRVEMCLDVGGEGRGGLVYGLYCTSVD